MGAFETSWFHAVWLAADGAVTGPLNAGKIGHPPTRGGFAAAAGDACGREEAEGLASVRAGDSVREVIARLRR